MRWWPKRDTEQHEAGHGRHGSLVRELLDRFSPEAAQELIRYGWHPTTPEERIAFAIATGAYREIVPFGDRAVAALKRSAFLHRWQGDLVDVLLHIGTPSAIECLGFVIVDRWRRGQWDQACWEALREPSVMSALIGEFYQNFDPRLARLLMDGGWQPSTVNDAVAIALANQDYATAASYGEDAVPMLRHALSVVQDSYAVLEALADTRSRAGAEAVLQALREQWARGVSRWTDSQLVARCGSAAVGPLLDLLQNDPTHVALAMDMLTAVLAYPETIATEDLERVAAMPDPVHLYQLPDDARTYEGRVDCSALREAASEELARRRSTFGA